MSDTPAHEPGDATRRRRTVLIVEDSEDNRLIYSMMLEYAGYRVVQAVNGADGIEQARAVSPDLVLMDVSIPVIDGLEATRRLKADAATRHIPVVALTAHALATDRQRALSAGCDGYLAKPIEPRAVLREVQRFLGAPERE